MGASERDEGQRASFREQVSGIEPEKLLFLDECGTNTALAPLYARAPKGERAYGQAPRNYGKNLTLIASMSINGMEEAMTLEGAMDGEAFEAYIRRWLAPSLVAGQVVMMDNLSVHKRDKIRELIEERGCRMLFLPPYSPDYNPIEHAFSKLKGLLRSAQARTHEALQTAISEALAAITAHDALGWFHHCGYSLHGSVVS
jgi:transposase